MSSTRVCVGARSGSGPGSDRSDAIALTLSPYLAAVASEAYTERLPALAPRRILANEQSRLTLALAVACLLVGVWLLLAPRSPDLAAQLYRTDVFARSGFTVWDDNWYAGHHMPGYSLLFPWLAMLLGMRLVGALAVLISTLAFEQVALACYGPRARFAAAFFAVAAAGDVWIGRLTFALGVTFAVLAVLAVVRGRLWIAAGATLLCALASPVAGLLLALAGVTYALAKRGYLTGVVLVVPALLVILPLQALFGEGGWEPFAASSIAAALAVTLAFLYVVPREEHLLRVGGVVYLGATLLSLAHTPMGSNIARYAVTLAGPLALCALARHGFKRPGRPLALTGLALLGIFTWTVWGPVRESVGVIGDPSTSEAYYAPLKRFLLSHGGTLTRTEVPLTHSHWEAALLASQFPLARGWERQLDTRYDALFFGKDLTPAAYRSWLLDEGIGYVALPDARLDSSSVQEAALIRKGLPYLREVLDSRHWRVFQVIGATPLASKPAVLSDLTDDSFTLRFAAGGSSLVRVHDTPYWSVTSGDACVQRAPGGWTAVHASRSGVVHVAARFSLRSALGDGRACSHDG